MALLIGKSTRVVKIIEWQTCRRKLGTLWSVNGGDYVERIENSG